jgi:hypothetical protein
MPPDAANRNDLSMVDGTAASVGRIHTGDGSEVDSVPVVDEKQAVEAIRSRLADDYEFGWTPPAPDPPPYVPQANWNGPARGPAHSARLRGRSFLIFGERARMRAIYKHNIRSA